MIKETVKVVLKILVVIGIILAFYKLPTIIADKWSYYQLKKKNISQELEEDE